MNPSESVANAVIEFGYRSGILKRPNPRQRCPLCRTRWTFDGKRVYCRPCGIARDDSAADYSVATKKTGAAQ